MVKLAHFLRNVAQAWDEATQEQRNKLGSAMFEDILIDGNRTVAVKPRPELEPFFALNYRNLSTSESAGAALYDDSIELEREEY